MIAIGEAAPLVRDALHDVVPVVDAASMREAVAQAFEAARPDGVVLLAPACASFDWFRTTRSADGCSRRKSGGCGSESSGRRSVRGACPAEARRAKAGAVSSRQSTGASGSLPLGTQTTPVCEVGVPFHEPADDC